MVFACGDYFSYVLDSDVATLAVVPDLNLTTLVVMTPIELVSLFTGVVKNLPTPVKEVTVAFTAGTTHVTAGAAHAPAAHVAPALMAVGCSVV